MGGIIARILPPSFKPERDIPDLSGKVAIVTGGNTGIGYETVKQLVLKDAKVYLAARTQERADAAIKRLEGETKKTAIFLQLDLADLKSVRKAAEEFMAKEEKLDLLFNNAGVGVAPPELVTAQDYDLLFGTNTLGHYFFTKLLIPALTKSFEISNVPARVMHTSSMVHASAPGSGIDYESLKGGPARDAYIKRKGNLLVRMTLYNQSKFGNILVSNHFAKKYSDVLVSCAVHPGGIQSELHRHLAGWMQVIVNSALYPTPMGALAQLWSGTVATPAQITGQYIVPWGKVGAVDKRTKSQKAEDELIAWMEEAVKEF